MQIRLGYNAVPKSARKLILEVFDSGQFSPGPKVREFEEKFAALHKAKYAVFVNSGTDALRLSLLAMKEKYGWKDGAEVAVPALTFVATVNVILQAGLKPFFVDVGMYDFCINPENLVRRCPMALVAVIPVHLFGQSCGPKIYELAKGYGLKVIEDSCETILNPLQGEVSCFSTYMAHHLTTGVGGLAVTDDFELSWKMRSYANHGRDALYIPGQHGLIQAKGKELLKRRFSFDRIGYSNRATEFEAALGLSQLEGLAGNVQRRRYIFEDLLDALSNFEDLRFLPSVEGNSCMMFPVVLKEDSKIAKYDLCLHLEKNGIETRDMMPITSQPCYQHLLKEEDFPVAKWINKNGFYIPVNPGMTDKDVAHIQKAFGSYHLTK